MTTRQRIERITKDALKQIEQIKKGSTKDFISIVDKMRRDIVLVIAESGEVNPINSETIKQRIQAISKDYEEKFVNALTENERRLFVKGIQLVDKVVKGGDILVGVPYLSEQKLELLKKYNAELVKGITDTARQRISQQIDLAVLGQKPQQEIINEIGRNLKDASVFGTIAKRAEIIHRTEVNRIQEIATNDRMKQVADQVPDLSKMWLHSTVGIPRPGHLALNRVVVRAREKFLLIGTDGIPYSVEAPLDPVLPVSEVANCFVGETVVDEIKPEAIFKSKYSGELLTIKTSRGYNITVTPNHPILTRSGFIAARNLRIGNDVISSPLGELSAVGNPNINNMPTTFEEKFNSFAIKSMGQRITCGNVNFYGDIPEGNVEIVFSDSLLKDGIDSFFVKPTRKFSFIASDITLTFFFPQSAFMKFFKTAFSSNGSLMCSIDLFLSLLSAHLFPSEQISIAGIPNNNTSLFKSVDNYRSRSLKNIGKFIWRFTNPIKFYKFLDIYGNIVRSTFDARFQQMPMNSSRANFQNAGNTVDAFPFFVEPDNISSIDSFHRKNIEVYTMQTLSGIYNANGILASNCRCKIIPIVGRFSK